MNFHLKKYVWVPLAAVAIALYLKTFHFGFVWDDQITIIRILPNFQYLLDVFKPLRMFTLPVNYFRPLSLFSWMIDQTLWGMNPMGYHATNVLLHAANVILVYFLAKRLLTKSGLAAWGAVAAALMFAVHPVQTEVVCWIAGRPELLFTAFSLLSFILFIQFRSSHQKKWLILAVSSWFLALLSKETAVSLLPCLFFYDMLFVENEKRSDIIKSYYWYIVVFLVFLFLRQRYLINEEVGFISGLDITTLFERVVSAYGFYIQRVIFPVSLCAFIPDYPQTPAVIFASLAITASVFAISVLMFRKGKKLPLYLACFFYVTLVPAILVALTNVSDAPVAERYLYLPLFAASFIIAGIAVVAGPAEKKYIIIPKVCICLTVLLFFGYKTILRIPVWENSFTFFKMLTVQQPDTGLPYQALGAAYQISGDYLHAIENYNKALSVQYSEDGRSKVYLNLGVIYIDLKKYDAAEKYLQDSLNIKKEGYVYYHMGRLYYMKAMEEKQRDKKNEFLAKSKGFLEECLKRSPDYREAERFLKGLEELLKADDVLSQKGEETR